MRSASLLGRPIDSLLKCTHSTHLVELGAGDGRLLLQIAKQNGRRWPRMKVDLLDLQPVVQAHTLEEYRALGWQADIVRAEVFDWLAQAPPAGSQAPIIVANLFLHHFDDSRLRRLLEGIAARACAFVCIEPRRSGFALLGSRMVGLLGANQTTRHDAVASVRAGFRAQELSAEWPPDSAWQTSETAVGLFSHKFIALKGPIADRVRSP